MRCVKQGNDPGVAKKETQRVDVELSFGAYVERYLALYGKRRWRPGTYSSVAANFRLHIIPALKSKSLPAINRRDLARITDAVSEKHPALPRNLFAHTRKLFSWAVERGDIERSPFEGLRSPPSVPSRERVLSDRELGLAWIAATQMPYPFGPLFRLLIATGQRRAEAAGLDWSELDQAAKSWVIPGSRTKNKTTTTVPLNALAVSVLDEVAGQKHWPSKGWVFSTNSTTPVSGYSRAKGRLVTAMQALGDETIEAWRVHDLRRTVATGLQRLGVRLEVTDAELNHVGGSRSGIVQVYQRHNWADEKRAALDAWATHVEKIVLRYANARCATRLP